MNRSDLIERIDQAQRDRLDRETVGLAVHMLIEVMSDALARGERIEIRGFGSFTARRYAGGFMRNPRTGERISVPARYRVIFRPGKELTERVEAAAQAERALGALGHHLPDVHRS